MKTITVDNKEYTLDFEQFKNQFDNYFQDYKNLYIYGSFADFKTELSNVYRRIKNVINANFTDEIIDEDGNTFNHSEIEFFLSKIDDNQIEPLNNYLVVNNSVDINRLKNLNLSIDKIIEYLNILKEQKYTKTQQDLIRKMFKNNLLKVEALEFLFENYINEDDADKIAKAKHIHKFLVSTRGFDHNINKNSYVEFIKSRYGIHIPDTSLKVNGYEYDVLSKYSEKIKSYCTE